MKTKYTEADLGVDSYRSPYISEEERNRRLEESDKIKKAFRKAVEERHSSDISLFQRQTDLLKPIVDPNFLKSVREKLDEEKKKEAEQKARENLAAEQQTKLEEVKDAIKDNTEVTAKAKLELLDKIEEIAETKADKEAVPEEINMEQEIKEAFEKQDDKLFGLVPHADNANDYQFGIAAELHKLHIRVPFHRISFDKDGKKIHIEREEFRDDREGDYKTYEAEVKDFGFTINLLSLLTKNNTTGGAARRDYVDMVKIALDPALRSLSDRANQHFAVPHGSPIYNKEFHAFCGTLRENKKFMAWFARAYDIQTRWQPAREARKKGKGFIVIAPNPPEQIKRLLVILGSKKAGNTAPEMLYEYTSILDTLLENKKINKKIYNAFLDKFEDSDTD